MKPIECAVLVAFISVIVSLTGPPSARAALDAQVVTIGGEVRERYEFRDQADFNSNASDTLSFIGSKSRPHPTTITSICTKGT